MDPAGSGSRPFIESFYLEHKRGREFIFPPGAADTVVGCVFPCFVEVSPCCGAG